jgi:glutamate dehydrogenase (NADP+)
VQKVNELGGKCVSLSDSGGTIYDEEGICADKLAWVMKLKNVRRGRIFEYIKKYPNAKYMERVRPWKIKCDIAMPSATQNEIDGDDAKALVANGCMAVVEGANMPTTMDAVHIFNKAGVMHAPGKAANAGGVATSGLEMSQNSMRLAWSRDEVDAKLHGIMRSIHKTCLETAEAYGTPGNYFNGANIAGFFKVANAMLDQGFV